MQPQKRLRPEGASKKTMPLAPDDHKGIIRRFLEVNRLRLERVKKPLSQRHAVMFDALMVLFHINHPSLPGFLSKDTPSGIAGYAPDNHAISAVKRIARSVDIKRRVNRRMDIESMFLMGSAGTISYSAKSDFDIWLCYNPELEKDKLDELKRKAEAITAWAEQNGMEVHFFLMTAAEVRNAQHEDLSSESSGSAQHQLLMDEFYRTAVLLAGRYPLWWLIPPGRECDYESYSQMLLEKRFVREKDIIDLGQIGTIPAGEFFGASLWQLYKAISSPYKSFLKILLIEIYASEFPTLDLLCHQYKKSVYAGKIAPEDLDPYLVMMQKIEQYLEQTDDTERLHLSRHSFYFKTNRRLSEIRIKPKDDTLLSAYIDMTQKWGWKEPDLYLLDTRRQWKINQVMEERRLLVNSLMRSYRQLSAFIKGRHELAEISQHDMTLLGRRLFAAFERKAGKIELINPGISDSMTESNLSVQKLDKAGWQLLRPDSSFSVKQGVILKRAPSILELLAWAYINGIADSNTDISVPANIESLTRNEIRAIIAALGKQYDIELISHPTTEDLACPSHARQASLFVNIGVNPHEDYNRQGLHYTSESLDPLNFGGKQENLVVTIDFIYATNWGEMQTKHYEGTNALTDCLIEFISLTSKQPLRGDALRTVCETPGRGSSIEQRIQYMFQEASLGLAHDDEHSTSSFITRIGGNYLVFTREQDKISLETADSLIVLMDILASPTGGFKPFSVDSRQDSLAELHFLSGINKQSHVQVCYKLGLSQAEFFILDECGALFHTRVPFYKPDVLIGHIQHFLQHVQLRRDAAYADAPVSTIEFFEISVTDTGEVKKKPVTVADDPILSGQMELQVISQTVDDCKGFSIYCNGEEFSTLEHGVDLFNSVARYIMGLRKSDEPYPIYITDIDLTNLVSDREPSKLQTIDYLRYKRFLERKLNDTLNGLYETES